MRNHFLIFLVGLVFTVNVKNVIAQDTIEPVNKNVVNSVQIDTSNNKSTTSSPKKKYRVGVSYVNGYPLFAFADIEDRGFGWALLEKFAEANNIEFEYSSMPITRLQPSMDSGAIDFIFPDNPRWSLYRSNRKPNIFSGPIMSSISVTFVRNEHKDIALEDIKKIAIPFGYTAFTWLDPIQTHGIDSMPVRDLSTALYSVVQNKVDAADVEYNIGQYLISQNPSLADLTINPTLPNANVDYHLSSIKHIMILEKLTNFVEQEKELVNKLRLQYEVKYHHEIIGGNLE